MKVLIYRVTIRGHYGYEDVKDMFRYSGDRPSKVESWGTGKPKTIIMRRRLKHRRRSKKFFYSQIKRRWESFGCEVEILEETNHEFRDKEYRYDPEATKDLVEQLIADWKACNE